VRSSSPLVRSEYSGRARSELVGGNATGGKVLFGDDGEVLSSESTGDGMRTGMDPSGTTGRRDLLL
jgi:hypothetical protein